MRRIFIVWVLIISVCSVSAYAERGFSNVEIKTHALTDKIAMLEGSGGNIGVIYGVDGIVMIDDQFIELSDKIKAALGELSGGKLRFLLNTHWHYDHTGGNRAFGKDTTIISHTNVRKLLSSDQTIEVFNKTVEASPKEALPVVTFDESVTIHLNRETIDIIHLPNAHTSGDSYVYFNESNVLHTGDLFFNGFFPFIDVEHGGSIDGYIAAVETLINLADEDTKIIPGHGPLADKNDYLAFLQMLNASRAFVADSLLDGKTLEEIQQTGLSDEWESWKGGFLNEATWLKIVYNSLMS